MPKIIPKLKEKIKKETKPGTWIISYLFPIEGWTPVRMLKFERHRRVYIYKKNFVNQNNSNPKTL